MNHAAAVPDWAGERRQMVERQLIRRGIRDPRVLEAMLRIPREEFIPQEYRHLSYADEPAPIGFAQTISQPYMTALMTECLDLKETDKVLEVGTGCGYHAAVLGALAARVISLEIIPELAERARRNLERTGLGGNISIICTDGSVGWAPEAPYDAISVAAAAAEAPPELLEQLKEGGRLVIPVGASWEQELRLYTKRADRVHWRVVTHCRFVPLRGEHGWE